MSFVSELEPREVWRHFDHILTIPRRSRDEGRIRDYVIGVARRCGLRHRTDAAGNLLVTKPGAAGSEAAPITVLQSHLDMVQEKNSDVAHDFDRDPIRPRLDGPYLKATGTTLGSDNGIGVAAMLAVVEARDLAHGRLELLFTVDEETGLSGAAGLAVDLLQGRQLINVDSEEEGVLTIGCAGGADSHLRLRLRAVAVPAGSTAVEVRLGGLRGGHSGVDIHLQRGNATKLLVRALYAVSLGRPLFQLSSLRGGNAHNAIPREARARLVLSGAARIGELRQALECEFEAIRTEFRRADPEMVYSVDQVEPPPGMWDEASAAKVLALIHGLPHGVLAMSQDMPGLVETSTNLAVVGESDGSFEIWTSTRSSIRSALEAARQSIRAMASLAGAEVTQDEGYPGWKPDLGSRLLAVVSRVHEERFGKPPRVGAVHAGLECGIIGEKYPGMDMISFGPQIEFPHSPDERVRVDSVGPFYELLRATLERLAGNASASAALTSPPRP